MRPVARLFPDMLPMSVGGHDLFGSQFLRNFGNVLSRNDAQEYPFYDGGCFFIYDPVLVVLRVVQIPIGECPCYMVSSRCPCSEYRPYFTACISGVSLRKDIAEGHKIILAFGSIYALRNGN